MGTFALRTESTIATTQINSTTKTFTPAGKTNNAATFATAKTIAKIKDFTYRCPKPGKMNESIPANHELFTSRPPFSYPSHWGCLNYNFRYLDFVLGKSLLKIKEEMSNFVEFCQK